MNTVKRYLSSIKWIVLGNCFYSLALNLFLKENGIAAGGFAGIATLINHYISVPVGMTVFIMNVPILLWAWKVKGKEYMFRCATGSIIYTIIADGSSFLPTLTTDKVAAAIMGGILYGVGITVMAECQAAAGGTDLLSRLMVGLKPFRKLSLGTMVFFLDGIVVIAAAFVYGNIMQSVYTMIGIFTYSVMSDFYRKLVEKCKKYVYARECGNKK